MEFDFAGYWQTACGWFWAFKGWADAQPEEIQIMHGAASGLVLGLLLILALSRRDWKKRCHKLSTEAADLETILNNTRCLQAAARGSDWSRPETPKSAVGPTNDAAGLALEAMKHMDSAMCRMRDMAEDCVDDIKELAKAEIEKECGSDQTPEVLDRVVKIVETLKDAHKTFITSEAKTAVLLDRQALVQFIAEHYDSSEVLGPVVESMAAVPLAGK